MPPFARMVSPLAKLADMCLGGRRTSFKLVTALRVCSNRVVPRARLSADDIANRVAGEPAHEGRVRGLPLDH